jgi:hypothetical protein
MNYKNTWVDHLPRNAANFASGVVRGGAAPVSNAAKAISGKWPAENAGKAIGGAAALTGAYALGKHRGKEKEAAMDQELAHAVIANWESGRAISEMQLYKAAQTLDIDPMAALVEARYFTYLDQCLKEKRAMSRGERIVFSAAAGIDSASMVKSASAYGLSPDDLIYEALRERDFVPDLQKIANLAAAIGGMDPSQGPGGKKPPGQGAPMDPMQAAIQQGGGEMPPQDPSLDPAADPMAQTAGGAMMAPPAEDAMLQQQQSARIKPSPTGPEQIAASSMGNLDELVQQGQQTYGEQATENGGTAPQGMPEPMPPPPSPEERIQQVGPNLDEETVARYAEQLQRFEEGFQMQIADPKMMVKFVKELQKLDGKRIDQGIKAMSQQLEQEQAQELGVDAQPTIDGPGGGGTGGMAGGAPGTKMAPKPGSEAQQGAPSQENPQAGPGSNSQPSAGATQSSQDGGQGPGQEQQSPPRQQQRPQPKAAPTQQQAAGAAVEKVANAARALARASF